MDNKSFIRGVLDALFSEKFFLFLFIFFIAFFYVTFSIPIISTGDGGELASTGFTLGVPHPPGYPIYTEISKLFTFIPVGNIGEKIAILSVFFAILTIVVLYKTVEILGIDKKAFYFGASLLAVSYTYMGQSLVIKFYTFNLFFVAVVFLIGVYFVKRGYDSRLVYVGSFLLGIIVSVHHLGLLITLPLFIVGLFYSWRFLKDLLKSFPFFVIGLLTFIHLPIRSVKEDSFLFTLVIDWDYFVKYLLRKTYEKSTVDTVKNLYSSFDSYLYSFNNVFEILYKNFSWLSVLLFLIGTIFLFRKDKKLGIFSLTTFVIYTFFLGILAFKVQNPSLNDWFVIGHQYFIPGLYFYIFIVIAGLGWFYEFLKNKNFSFVYRVIPPVLAVFPLIYISDRMFDMNYGTEYVPYSHSKVIFGSLPVGSIYISFGDNHTFQGWYLKSITGFRNDVCQLKQDKTDRISFTLQGCRPSKLYSKLFPQFFKKGDLKFYAEEDRLYSIIPILKNSPYSKIYSSELYIYSFRYFPKQMETVEREKLKKENLNMENRVFQNFIDCVSHKVDEPFSKYLCGFLIEYYLYLAKQKEPFISVNDITFDIRRAYTMDYIYRIFVNVKIGDENFIYVWRAKALEGYNKPENFFYFGENGE